MSWKINGIGMWIVVFAASASACTPGSSGRTTFNSRVEVANAAPVKRLLVIESVESPGFGHDMHVGFAAALANRLSVCGVAARLLQAQSLDSDPGARVLANVQEFQADAVLLIKAEGGRIMNSADTDSALIFDLKLIETASQTVTWQAKSQFEVRLNSIWIYDTDSGISFGTSIVSQLRDDRVLTGCPALAAGWPELPRRRACLAERQRLLAEARRQSDQTERMRLISSAPDCE